MLARDLGQNTEYLLISFWDSLEAVGAFDGEDAERARYYQKDPEFLLEFEPRASHRDVVARL